MLTNEQKSIALRLRREGLRYSEIAKQTGIPASTIRSLCDRAKADPNGALNIASAGSLGAIVKVSDHISGFCKQCGNDMHVTASNRMRRFCSETCRQKWWRAHHGEVVRDAATTACAECGRLFKTGGRASRKYCSSDCYLRHRFQNRMEGKYA